MPEFPLVFPVWLLYVFTAAAIGASVLAIASAATAAVQRWRTTQHLGFLSVLGAIGTIATAMLTLMVAHAIEEDGHYASGEMAERFAHSAVQLMESISPAAPAAILGAATWYLAYRRGRRLPRKARVK